MRSLKTTTFIMSRRGISWHIHGTKRSRRLNLPGLMNTFPGPPEGDGLSGSCSTPVIQIDIIMRIVNKETESIRVNLIVPNVPIKWTGDSDDLIAIGVVRAFDS